MPRRIRVVGPRVKRPRGLVRLRASIDPPLVLRKGAKRAVLLGAFAVFEVKNNQKFETPIFSRMTANGVEAPPPLVALR